MGWDEQGETKKEEKKTEKINNDRKFVTLLYGDGSTGKTFISMTFPEPIYFIDTEGRAENTKYALFPNKFIDICQPKDLKEHVDKDMDDIFDEIKSIRNTTVYLSDYISKVHNGEIKGGTLVFDSVSDCWSWIQSWMFDKLSKLQTKDGRSKASDDMRTVLDQRDWKIATNKHEGIVIALRVLAVKYNIYVVFTAREKLTPEYVNDVPKGLNKIRCQKDMPYAVDVIFNLRKVNGRYMAICEKLGVQETPSVEHIEKLNFEKIVALKPLG